MANITLPPPLEITSRLLPGITVGDVTMSAEPTGSHDHYGKPVWRLTFDKHGAGPSGRYYRSYVDETLAGPRSYAEAIETALSFLMAAVESYRWETRTGRAGENTNLFPRPIVAWAAHNSSELETIQIELSETLVGRD